MRKTACFLGLLTLGAASQAQPLHAALAECALLGDPWARLACYDRLQPPVPGGSTAMPALTVKPEPAPQVAAQPKAEGEPSTLVAGFGRYSSLSEAWDLEDKDPRGLFAMRPYRPNYFMPAWYSSNRSAVVRSPSRGEAQLFDGDVDKLEAKFQLSFKTKVGENLLGSPADLWFAYSQASHWQVYNKAQSSPFRVTDYEPELILTAPAPAAWSWDGGGVKLLGLGFVHQSNGQSDPLSRSWNRVYAMAALEQGNLSLQGRVWRRLREKPELDDNPDITDYMGYGDLQAIYRRGEHTLSALARANLQTGKGALQLDWSFPMPYMGGRLRGYVQGFSGYGENLLDYNRHVNAIGVGLSLTDWLGR